MKAGNVFNKFLRGDFADFSREKLQPLGVLPFFVVNFHGRVYGSHLGNIFRGESEK